MTLKKMPFDVYVQILGQLPISAHSNDSPRTLAACLHANSILRSAASIATLWEPHYRARYTISLPASELSRKQALGDDWKALYMERVRLDRQATKILDGIIMERHGRLERAREVTSTLSYDVWNALAAEAQCPIPEPFRGVYDNDEGDVPRHAVPRRFWARCLLGTIARSHAVRTWSEIKNKEEDTHALETAIACLSSYFAHPPMEVSNGRTVSFSKSHFVKISSLLDILSDFCRSYLADKNLPIVPAEFNHSEAALCRISSSICDFLWERGFRAAERELQNRLEHCALITEYHRLSIQCLQHAISPLVPHHAQRHNSYFTGIRFRMPCSPPGNKGCPRRLSCPSFSYRLIP